MLKSHKMLRKSASVEAYACACLTAACGCSCSCGCSCTCRATSVTNNADSSGKTAVSSYISSANNNSTKGMQSQGATA